MSQIEQLLKTRILILDGAMGTMIQRYNLEEEDFRGQQLKNHPSPLKGNNDLLSITQPDIIASIHREYLDAGADIIETNTFSSTSIAQDDYDLSHLAYDLNQSSAAIAKKACEDYTAQTPQKPRFVAGAIGPTNRTASLSPDVNDPGFRAITFDQLAEAYLQQAQGLMDGGVDLFLVETIFDTLNAKAALFAIRQLLDKTGKQIPIMISGTITDASGRTLSGQTAQSFAISLMHANPISIGFNCALGASQLRQYLQVLSQSNDCFISAHPNAGLPNEMGQYDETPDEMADQIETYLQENLINIIGGCCGTTPDHIKAIADRAAKYEPRTV